MDKSEAYVERLNRSILPYIDYEQLQRSYETEDKSYAKTVLYFLNKAAKEEYGSDVLSYSEDLEMAFLPGVIRSQDTGKLCLAFLDIDLSSSGEHCGTQFLTQYGIVAQGHIEDEEILNFMNEMYGGGYDYAYTLPVERDIHVNPEELPEEITDFLADFENHGAETENSVFQRLTEDMEDEDDLEL